MVQYIFAAFEGSKTIYFLALSFAVDFLHGNSLGLIHALHISNCVFACLCVPLHVSFFHLFFWQVASLSLSLSICNVIPVLSETAYI